MYETDLYQTDDELEQALYAALGREPAPDTLILRVERRLFAARRAPAVPSFGLLSVSTRSAWSSLWSIAAHAAVFALIAFLFLHGKRDSVLKTRAALTQIDLQPFVPITPRSDQSGGGGGGGAHDILQAPKGKLPKSDSAADCPAHGAEE